MAVELLHDPASGCHCLQMADRGDVEDEQATRVEVFVGAIEAALPRGQAEQVVKALVGAHDDIEPGVEPEAGHIGQVQRGPAGQFVTGNGQHAGRYIQPAHLVRAGQQRGHAAGSAPQVKQGRGLAVTPPDDVAEERRLGRGIAGHGVVMRGEQIVNGHHQRFYAGAAGWPSLAGGDDQDEACGQHR
jgi:hypothetical protein